MHQRLPPRAHIRRQQTLHKRRRRLEREGRRAHLAGLGRLSGLRVGVGYGYVVDCFYVGRGAQVGYAGREAFGSREEEVRGEGFVGFHGVGSGGEALCGC